jgi:hypothetical protein
MDYDDIAPGFDAEFVLVYEVLKNDFFSSTYYLVMDLFLIYDDPQIKLKRN